MKILSLCAVLHKQLLSAQVETDEGVRYEFTSFAGGAFEVYDYPGDKRRSTAWPKGLTRFCGYMPAEQASRLVALLVKAALALPTNDEASAVLRLLRNRVQPSRAQQVFS